MSHSTVLHHATEVKLPTHRRLPWPREAMVARDRAGMYRIESWLARAELDRVSTAIYQMEHLMATQLLTTELRAQIRTDLERARSMQKHYRASLKAARGGVVRNER